MGLWIGSGVATTIFSCHFGGGCREIVLKHAHHPLLIRLYGEEVDDGIQAAIEIH